jgi:hypothetical protein
MGHAFFSLWEKYPSEAKGDEGLMSSSWIEDPLTPVASLGTSPEGRGMSWLGCPLPRGEECPGSLRISWLRGEAGFLPILF